MRSNKYTKLANTVNNGLHAAVARSSPTATQRTVNQKSGLAPSSARVLQLVADCQHSAPEHSRIAKALTEIGNVDLCGPNGMSPLILGVSLASSAQPPYQKPNDRVSSPRRNRCAAASPRRFRVNTLQAGVTHSKAVDGIVQFINMMTDLGANLDHADLEGCTALIHATKAGCIPALQALIKAGANVDIVDSQGSGALHYAAALGNVELVQVLLDANADPLVANVEGCIEHTVVSIEG